MKDPSIEPHHHQNDLTEDTDADDLTNLSTGRLLEPKLICRFFLNIL